jgi:hypothetical protein
MASLGSMSTGNILAWDKYVKNNPLWDSKKEYEIEYDSDATLYDSSMKAIDVLKSKTKIYITDKNITVKDNKKYAKVRAGSKSGLILITKIRKPTGKNTLKDEQMAIASFDAMFKQIGHPIDIKVGKNVYKDIVGVVNVSGTPKADFALINKSKQKVIFISHKKAGGPEAFQQYGGVTEKAGAAIYNHREVKSFMANVAQNIKNGKLLKPLYTKVKDQHLIGMSIYGPNFGNSKHSEENVTLIGQGTPILNKKNDDMYELTFSSHMSTNPDLKHFTGGYLPVLGATYREGRGFEFNGKRYDGARLGIYPVKLLSGRSGAEEV